jgi:hypothetical protein
MTDLRLVEGINLGSGPVTFCICDDCSKGNLHKSPFKLSTSPRADKIGGRICGDVCGPVSFRYMLLFKDEASCWITAYFMKSKTKVLNHIKTLYAFIKNQTGFSIQILRTDNGTEFKNAETTKWTLEMGIRHETSCVYTPEQNGTAERANRTIMEMTRCMLYSSNAPLWLWAEAASYAVYIRNIIPPGKREQSPFEIMHKHKPDLSPIRIFGSKVSALVPDAKRSKLESKCSEGFLVGYDDVTKGYWVFIPLKGKVIVTRDVIIDET